jgi:hypothetical protein
MLLRLCDACMAPLVRHSSSALIRACHGSFLSLLWYTPHRHFTDSSIILAELLAPVARCCAAAAAKQSAALPVKHHMETSSVNRKDWDAKLDVHLRGCLCGGAPCRRTTRHPVAGRVVWKRIEPSLGMTLRPMVMRLTRPARRLRTPHTWPSSTSMRIAVWRDLRLSALGWIMCRGQTVSSYYRHHRSPGMRQGWLWAPTGGMLSTA